MVTTIQTNKVLRLQNAATKTWIYNNDLVTKGGCELKKIIQLRDRNLNCGAIYKAVRCISEEGGSNSITPIERYRTRNEIIEDDRDAQRILSVRAAVAVDTSPAEDYARTVGQAHVRRRASQAAPAGDGSTAFVNLLSSKITLDVSGATFYHDSWTDFHFNIRNPYNVQSPKTIWTERTRSTPNYADAAYATEYFRQDRKRQTHTTAISGTTTTILVSDSWYFDAGFFDITKGSVSYRKVPLKELPDSLFPNKIEQTSHTLLICMVCSDRQNHNTVATCRPFCLLNYRKINSTEEETRNVMMKTNDERMKHIKGDYPTATADVLRRKEACQ
ncbi:hypothetical protein ACHAP8_009070 [Fusarium lateritium]